MAGEGNGIETLATVKVEKSGDLYKIVDSLNRTLKDRDLMFGLALDEQEDNKMVFTIYKT
ncbi:YpmA family protein [Evansella sp. LMS18]|uniref:YpmA family protein n=1 Tax=Evansella sp. LMS18 TaxID=2924033 RepID=UPI0020D116DB|nr:YpmA family protein [Evansella sp. LMS18]UTR09660.1 YpmA family protein [Evansella sp. LMS18]